MTSWVEFLVEEPSMEAALRELVPRIRPGLEWFDVHSYGGKDDLLAKLPRRLRGYSGWAGAGKIVVVLDRDQDDCRRLEARIERMASAAGLRPKSSNRGTGFNVLVRVAVEELEAWFLGDTKALRDAYPRLSGSLGRKRRFRDPDEMDDPWRALERELQRVGYFPGGLAKIDLARAVARRMDPAANRSRSFCAFRDGLLSL